MAEDILNASSLHWKYYLYGVIQSSTTLTSILYIHVYTYKQTNKTSL